MRWKRHDDEREGKIIIELEGRIDTNNAPQTDKEIMEILSKNYERKPGYHKVNFPQNSGYP